MSPRTLIFSASFIGVNFATPSELQELLNFLHKNAISRINMARRYPAVSSSRSEQLLGEVKATEQAFAININIKVVGLDAGGSITETKFESLVSETLEALGVNEVSEGGALSLAGLSRPDRAMDEYLR